MLLFLISQLDIGANQGLSIFPYYARGWRIIAFEPIPANVNTVRRNIFINGVSNETIALVEGAVTNETGTVKIYAPRGRADNTAISLKGSNLNVKKGSVDEVTVPAITVDNYLDNAVSPALKKNIHLVKIDTQGHELSVLQGMQKFLSDPPSVEDLGGWSFTVIAEYDRGLQEASGHGPEDMLNFMRGMGYDVRCGMDEDMPIVSPAQPNCPDVIFSKGKPVRPA